MKKALLFVIGLMLTSTLLAGPVGKEEAKAKALTFLTGKVGAGDGRAKAPLQEEQLSLATTGDAYHVFNIGSDGGFVIVSASDLTPDIIGYTDEGTFDANNIPDNMKAWLQEYANQIAWVEKNGEQVATESKVRKAPAVKSSIAPLIQTKWDQSNPYNYYCPDFFTTGTKCVTGCMATALAQILYYNNQKEGYPTGTIADRAAYDCETNWGGYGHVHVDACPATTFDWANMQLTYTGKEEVSSDVKAQAVAKLMQYCGATIDMDYANSANGGSGASSDIRVPLKTYFGYGDNIKYCSRSNFTTTEWENLIYGELAVSRPVLHSGSSTGGGHAFICDGYSEDGYFHINWGWGGAGNGYYLLNIANPHETGVGAGSSDDGFTMNQYALIGITKTGSAVEEREIRLEVGVFTYAGPTTISRSASCAVKYDYTLYNTLFYTHSFDFALAVYDESEVQIGDVLPVAKLTDVEPAYGRTNTRTATFDFSTIPAGTYKLKILSRLNGATEWLKSIAADDRYIQMVADASNVTFTTVTPTISMTASDVTPLTCTKGELTTVTATITNNGSSYNGNLYLFVGGTKVAGNGISVEGGKKTKASFAFKYTGDVPADKIMKITTDEAGSKEIWSGTMHAVAGVTGNDTPALTFSTTLNVTTVGSNKYLLGNKLIGVVTATNSTGSNYTGDITLVRHKYEGGMDYSSWVWKTVTVPAGSSVDVTFEYDAELDKKYGAQVKYKHGGAEELAGVVDKEYIAKPAITVITADGTETLALATASYAVPAGAAVIDLRGQSVVTSITPNSNPNCLYLLDESAATPTGISNNVVKGTTAANIVLTDDGTHGFYTPIDFTTTAISYTRTFTTGADKTTGGGWNTLVLPFDVTAVKKKGTDAIDWFKSASDTGKNFWLFAFKSDNKTNVDFTYTDAIKAYTPYLVNLPNATWGTENQLTSVPITFEGAGALIKADAKSATSGSHFIFSGDVQQTAVTQCYVLNGAGTEFAKTTGNVPAFQAYFYPTTRDWLGSTLTIGFADDNEATNILSVDSEEQTTDATDGWYTLQGVKLEGKPTQKGIYIYNGKKVMVQ